MFCPNCGAGNQSANGYCKSCGEWLADPKRRPGSSFGGDTPQQNIFTGLFMSALSAIVALISAFALYATYLGTDEAKWSVYLAAGFCLCIALWQVSSLIVGLKLRRRLNKAQAGSAAESQLNSDQPSPLLRAADTSNLVRPASITENTTDLLEPILITENKERRT